MAAVECQDPRTFDKYLREGFFKTYGRTEAARAVVEFRKDMPLSDAVASAIQTLPTRATKELRRAVDDYSTWCQAHVLSEVLESASKDLRLQRVEPVEMKRHGAVFVLVGTPDDPGRSLKSPYAPWVDVTVYKDAVVGRTIRVAAINEAMGAAESLVSDVQRVFRDAGFSNWIIPF